MYQCAECHYATTKIGNFKRHKRVHQKAFVGNFKCSLCNFKGTSKQNVTRHLGEKHLGQGNVLTEQEETANSHPDPHPEPLPDPHLNADPQENIVFEESFQCSACDYRSPRKQNVIRHQSLKHSAEEDATTEPEQVEANKSKPDPHPEIMFLSSYQCSLCPYWSTKKQNVVRHLSTKHDGNGIVLTQTKSNPDPPLVSSIKPQTDLEPQNKIIFEEMFQCSVCDYKSISKQNVMEHQSMKHGNEGESVPSSISEMSFLENFMCNLCHYRSNKKQNVKRHLSQVHDSKGLVLIGTDRKVAINPYQEIMFVANFPCNQCTYSSTKKQNLIRHQSLIHGKKKDAKKTPKLEAAPKLYSESTEEQDGEEEEESVPAKRLLLAECGLIWHSNEIAKKKS